MIALQHQLELPNHRAEAPWLSMRRAVVWSDAASMPVPAPLEGVLPESWASTNDGMTYISDQEGDRKPVWAL